MPDNQAVNTTLPFSLFVEGGKSTPLSSGSISFQGSGDCSILYRNYLLQNGTLQKISNQKEMPRESIDSRDSISVLPFFSISAIVLLILFRNLFFSTFQRYFLSPVNNYEIDFNFQKIGLVPLIFSMTITLFAFSEKMENSGFLSNSPGFWIEHLKVASQILVYPLSVSIFLVVFLNFSTRFFPILFSDIKSLFFLSLIAIIWNFLSFGSPLIQKVPIFYFYISLSALFLIIRSFLFFQVMRKAYRFKMPITLFYICILNLGTFLLLYRGLKTNFSKLL